MSKSVKPKAIDRTGANPRGRGMANANGGPSHPAKDPIVSRIQRVLTDHYLPEHPEARVELYRYNPGSIRIRIIDQCFAGIPITQRTRGVWKMLSDHLTDDEFGEIHQLLLFAPGEEQKSIANMEFENPTPMF